MTMTTSPARAVGQHLVHSHPRQLISSCKERWEQELHRLYGAMNPMGCARLGGEFVFAFTNGVTIAVPPGTEICFFNQAASISNPSSTKSDRAIRTKHLYAVFTSEKVLSFARGEFTVKDLRDNMWNRFNI